MKKKLISAFMGLLMGIVPSNRVSNGLISEILGTVFEGTVLGACDFIYLPVFFDKLFQIHTVYVTSDDIQKWSEDDFMKCRGKRILLSDGKIKFVSFYKDFYSKFGCSDCGEFNKKYGIEFYHSTTKCGRQFCSCFWHFLIVNACVIPDFIGRLRNIYGCVKSSKDIEKCKNELEKYQKIHENHVNKIENKNGSGSSYEGEK